MKMMKKKIREKQDEKIMKSFKKTPFFNLSIHRISNYRIEEKQS